MTTTETKIESNHTAENALTDPMRAKRLPAL